MTRIETARLDVEFGDTVRNSVEFRMLSPELPQVSNPWRPNAQQDAVLANVAESHHMLYYDYLFVNKARITELYNEGSITAQQMSDIHEIVGAHGGLYWDELPDVYEKLSTGAFSSWEYET